MIRVNRASEPSEFNERVRVPGNAFLTGCPRPTTKQWATHSYWRRVLQRLHSAYGGICAYSCHWIPYDTGADTVEHFIPKSTHPKAAYEWSNYRLVCQLLNARKRDNQSVLDPFTIDTGWFIIDFPGLMVKPAPSLTGERRAQVIATRDILGLNDDATCLMMRLQFVLDYCRGQISFSHLEQRAPFLASQMKEQGLESLQAIQTIMNTFPPGG